MIKNTHKCKWVLAGFASNINTIDDDHSTDKYYPSRYQKKELVTTTTLYCPKCGEFLVKKVYT